MSVCAVLTWQFITIINLLELGDLKRERNSDYLFVAVASQYRLNFNWWASAPELAVYSVSLLEMTNISFMHIHEMGRTMTSTVKSSLEKNLALANATSNRTQLRMRGQIVHKVTDA